MNEQLKKIIKTSTFTVDKERYVYVKAKTIPNMNDHFMVSIDKDEITVVTKKENVIDLELIEKNKD